MRRLQERVRLAAGRTTALNEQALRRISADLHDGPGQALALALLRLDSLESPADARSTDFATVHGAVRDALNEVRSISAGLRLPELGRSMCPRWRSELLSITSGAAARVSIARSDSYQRARRSRSRSPCFGPCKSLCRMHRGTERGRTSWLSWRWTRDGLLLEVADSGPGFDLSTRGYLTWARAGWHARTCPTPGRLLPDRVPARPRDKGSCSLAVVVPCRRRVIERSGGLIAVESLKQRTALSYTALQRPEGE